MRTFDEILESYHINLDTDTRWNESIKLAAEEYANQDKWISVEDLLDNFKEGKVRYNTDPKFRAYIECILRGDNVYKLMDSLL